MLWVWSVKNNVITPKKKTSKKIIVAKGKPMQLQMQMQLQKYYVVTGNIMQDMAQHRDLKQPQL